MYCCPQPRGSNSCERWQRSAVKDRYGLNSVTFQNPPNYDGERQHFRLTKTSVDTILHLLALRNSETFVSLLKKNDGGAFRGLPPPLLRAVVSGGRLANVSGVVQAHVSGIRPRSFRHRAWPARSAGLGLLGSTPISTGPLRASAAAHSVLAANFFTLPPLSPLKPFPPPLPPFAPPSAQPFVPPPQPQHAR